MAKQARSKNPNNPECSSVKQALLDLQATGFNNCAIQTILDEIDSKPDLLNQADNLYHSHQYPQSKITFAKITVQSNFVDSYQCTQ